LTPIIPMNILSKFTLPLIFAAAIPFAAHADQTITGNLVVTNNITSNSGRIYAANFFQTPGQVSAGAQVVAGTYMTAGSSISAGTTINANQSITAGTALNSSGTITGAGTCAFASNGTAYSLVVYSNGALVMRQAQGDVSMGQFGN